MSESSLTVPRAGARGGRLGDDWAAIQECLDSGAKHVVIPEGVFILSRPLVPVEGQWVELHGTLKIADAVVRDLAEDLEEGGDTVVVTDSTGFEVGQSVLVYDNDLPIYNIAWADPRVHGPRRGPGFQDRLQHAGAGRIAAIDGPRIRIEGSSYRAYRTASNAVLATQTSAILIQESNIRLSGTGVIDGNKARQIDVAAAPFAGPPEEDVHFGCGVAVVADRPIRNVVIEGITVQDCVLHNVAFGVPYGDLFPECLLVDGVIRNVRSLRAHDKNIVIGRCHGVSIINNEASFAEYEDGIIMHQVWSPEAASRFVMIHGNRCVGNGRGGVHVGAGNHHVQSVGNFCSGNGFNYTFNGDNCTSIGDVADGCGSSLYPAYLTRPSVTIAGRRILVSGLSVTDAPHIAVGVSGEDVLVTQALLSNNGDLSGTGVGVAVEFAAGSHKGVWPAVGIEPQITERQSLISAERVVVSGVSAVGFATGIAVNSLARDLKFENNHLAANTTQQVIVVTPEATDQP